MEIVEVIGVLTLLALALLFGDRREGVMLYVMAGMASIAYGLTWRGTYDTAAGLVFSISLIGLGIYCLILSLYNVINWLRSR